MTTIDGTIEIYRRQYNIPKEKESAINWIIDHIRNNEDLSVNNNSNKHNDNARYDEELNTYYEGFIKDIVKSLKKKKGISYVFNFNQIKDVLKVLPKACFKYLYDSDCFEVTNM